MNNFRTPEKREAYREKVYKNIKKDILEEIRSNPELEEYNEKTTNLLVDQAMIIYDNTPNDDEVLAEGINLEDWRDPEIWDDQEYRFFYQWHYERLSQREVQVRSELAEFLQVPAIWNLIIKTVKDKVK